MVTVSSLTSLSEYSSRTALLLLQQTTDTTSFTTDEIGETGGKDGAGLPPLPPGPENVPADAVSAPPFPASSPPAKSLTESLFAALCAGDDGANAATPDLALANQFMSLLKEIG